LERQSEIIKFYDRSEIRHVWNTLVVSFLLHVGVIRHAYS